jgi:hypothetical protein
MASARRQRLLSSGAAIVASNSLLHVAPGRLPIYFVRMGAVKPGACGFAFFFWARAA